MFYGRTRWVKARTVSGRAPRPAECSTVERPGGNRPLRSRLPVKPRKAWSKPRARRCTDVAAASARRPASVAHRSTPEGSQRPTLACSMSGREAAHRGRQHYRAARAARVSQLQHGAQSRLTVAGCRRYPRPWRLWLGLHGQSPAARRILGRRVGRTLHRPHATNQVGGIRLHVDRCDPEIGMAQQALQHLRLHLLDGAVGEGVAQKVWRSQWVDALRKSAEPGAPSREAAATATSAKNRRRTS